MSQRVENERVVAEWSMRKGSNNIKTMSKMSITGIDRRFDWDKNVRRVTPMGEVVKGGIVRRSTPKPSLERKKVGDCTICGMPVMVSEGQLINYRVGRDGAKFFSHKSCRKENR